MKRLGLIVGLLTLLMAVGCGRELKGSGNIITETYEVSEFDEIDFSSVGQVNIIQDGSSGVSITGDDNIVELYEVEVRGNRLDIDSESYVNFSPSSELVIDIYLSDLTELSISGAGDILGENLQLEDLEIDLTGAGQIELSGSAETLDLNSSGAADIDVQNLEVERAAVNLTGVGNITLWVTDALNARISGAGNISYYGEPEVDSDISGVGRINSSGAKGGR